MLTTCFPRSGLYMSKMLHFAVYLLFLCYLRFYYEPFSRTSSGQCILFKFTTFNLYCCINNVDAMMLVCCIFSGALVENCDQCADEVSCCIQDG